MRSLRMTSRSRMSRQQHNVTGEHKVPREIENMDIGELVSQREIYERIERQAATTTSKAYASERLQRLREEIDKRKPRNGAHLAVS